MPESLFRPGDNCAATARAARVSFVVDAEDYFRAFMHACRKAQRSITVLGWDFDSRTPLALDTFGKPVLLGDFLNDLAATKRGLKIRILDWDYPMVFGTDRESPPGSPGGWKKHRRIDLRFDDTHPVGGSHHQKIVIVDETLAFAGGLDLTNRRWDTRAHQAGDPRRVFEEKPYPPFHDVIVAMDGGAVAPLLDIARERWRLATGETIKPARGKGDVWPDDLPVHATDVEVAISRTAPPGDPSPGIHEVYELYVDMIEAAKEYIYIENQYFTSEKIGEALKASLAKPAGPEVLVVTRLLSHGWLEEITMTTLRTKLVRELRAADAHERFHVFYPDVPGLGEGTCLDIHSKVMIVDDEWLRIGSSNLSNRSMGMDTECDVTLEARGEERVKKAIRRFRDDLLAEHVGGEVDAVAAACDGAGRMAKAISTLGSPTRSLKRLECEEIPETQLAIAKVGDPEEPILEGMVQPGSPVAAVKGGFATRRALHILAAVILVALALALVWTHTPLKDVVTRENAAQLASWFSERWWAPALVVIAYTPASFIMFPRWLITMTAVLAFGPWEGFVLAMTGVIIAGVVTFVPGRLVQRDTVRRVAGPRLKPVTRFMERKGLVAVTLVRLVPIAPFPVVNLVMGAMGVKLAHFILGTFIGMLPGMLAATVLSDQLASALEDPTRVNFWLIAAVVVGIAGIVFLGQRYVRKHSRAH
ncbi:MAG: VTT domain-containing protein [Usitatibacter sp.]